MVWLLERADLRAALASRHGMPEGVRYVLRGLDLLRVENPHAISTVRRRPAHWSTVHRLRGLDGPFKALPAHRALVRRSGESPATHPQERAATLKVIEALLTYGGVLGAPGPAHRRRRGRVPVDPRQVARSATHGGLLRRRAETVSFRT